jgi:hypothetical protein
VDNNDRVLVYGCHSGDKCVATVPWVEVVSVSYVAFDLLSVSQDTDLREENPL